MTRTGEVDLEGDDPRVDDVRTLVAHVDFLSLHTRTTRADSFSYTFSVPGHEAVTVAEHELTHDLRKLVELLLDRD
jgi:hypothetical protein